MRRAARQRHMRTSSTEPRPLSRTRAEPNTTYCANFLTSLSGTAQTHLQHKLHNRRPVALRLNGAQPLMQHRQVNRARLRAAEGSVPPAHTAPPPRTSNATRIADAASIPPSVKTPPPMLLWPPPAPLPPAPVVSRRVVRCPAPYPGTPPPASKVSGNAFHVVRARHGARHTYARYTHGRRRWWRARGHAQGEIWRRSAARAPQSGPPCIQAHTRCKAPTQPPL